MTLKGRSEKFRSLAGGSRASPLEFPLLHAFAWAGMGSLFSSLFQTLTLFCSSSFKFGIQATSTVFEHQGEGEVVACW